MKNTLLWFQRDLRVHDNPALNWALQQDKPIVAIYIHSPQENAPWAEGAASRWWLHQSLKKLSADLLQLNIKLHFFNADSVEKIPRLVTEANIDGVVWTNRNEPQRRACEASIARLLLAKGITLKRIQDGLLTTPEQFLTASKNTPYRVFTPFYRKLRAQLDLADFYANQNNLPEKSLPAAPTLAASLSLEQLQLLDQHHWHNKLHAHCTPGEDAALDKLDRFIDTALSDYCTQRDVPAVDGSSGLSAHLHFGEISPQQIVAALLPLIEMQGGKTGAAAEAFLRQLIWREFARYILWHFPETSTQPMNRKFTRAFWQTDNALLKKWQQGKTGVGMIDAGMKQLWETGSMHNRVRMLAASLLTKNMGIAWQHGAQWFWDTLVDADLANNSMGWQWVAGCGVDAAPYYRIFNPLTQAQKFDPQNIYIERWLAPASIQKTAPPVIDIALSRQQALERYRQFVRDSDQS